MEKLEKVTDAHGEALVKVMVKQGKMLTQSHSKLDHDDPDTRTLDDNERLEYKEVRANTLDSVEDQQVGNKDMRLTTQFERSPRRGFDTGAWCRQGCSSANHCTALVRVLALCKEEKS